MWISVTEVQSLGCKFEFLLLTCSFSTIWKSSLICLIEGLFHFGNCCKVEWGLLLFWIVVIEHAGRALTWRAGGGCGCASRGLGCDVFHTFAQYCTSTFEQVSRCVLICSVLINCLILLVTSWQMCAYIFTWRNREVIESAFRNSFLQTHTAREDSVTWCCLGVQISSSMSKRCRGNRTPSRERCRVESSSSTLTQRPSWNVLDACAKSGRDYSVCLVRKRDGRFRTHLEQYWGSVERIFVSCGVVNTHSCFMNTGGCHWQ